MPGCRGRPAVVLLAEDDAADVELARRTLQGDVVMTELHVVADGEAALNYLQRLGRFAGAGRAPRPDLVLLDLNMPRIDGRQVLAVMRKSEDLCRIPVVVLTTSQQEEDIIRSRNLGCDDFITKPIEIQGLIQAIRRLGRYRLELVTLSRN